MIILRGAVRRSCFFRRVACSAGVVEWFTGALLTMNTIYNIQTPCHECCGAALGKSGHSHRRSCAQRARWCSLPAFANVSSNSRNRFSMAESPSSVDSLFKIWWFVYAWLIRCCRCLLEPVCQRNYLQERVTMRVHTKQDAAGHYAYRSYPREQLGKCSRWIWNGASRRSTGPPKRSRVCLVMRRSADAARMCFVRARAGLHARYSKR